VHVECCRVGMESGVIASVSVRTEERATLRLATVAVRQESAVSFVKTDVLQVRPSVCLFPYSMLHAISTMSAVVIVRLEFVVSMSSRSLCYCCSSRKH